MQDLGSLRSPHKQCLVSTIQDYPPPQQSSCSLCMLSPVPSPQPEPTLSDLQELLGEQRPVCLDHDLTHSSGHTVGSSSPHSVTFAPPL